MLFRSLPKAKTLKFPLPSVAGIVTVPVVLIVKLPVQSNLQVFSMIKLPVPLATQLELPLTCWVPPPPMKRLAKYMVLLLKVTGVEETVSVPATFKSELTVMVAEALNVRLLKVTVDVLKVVLLFTTMVPPSVAAAVPAIVPVAYPTVPDTTKLGLLMVRLIRRELVVRLGIDQV